MRSLGRLGLLLGLILLCSPAETCAQILGRQRVASGLTAPIYVTHAPGDHSRLFIVERGGAIKILNTSTGIVNPTPFLTIPGVDAAGEGGLLGMAFHPDYATNGKFYVNVTIDNGGLVFENEVSPFSSHVRQYTVSANPNVANATPTPVLSIVRPQSNHVGGWIGFSPTDGNLYVGSGDGGGANDLDSDGDSDGHTPVTGNAQDITNNLLGKMLRINVNGDDFPADANRNYAIPAGNPFISGPNAAGDDEIWSYGLRNPFRAGFDRANGNLWIGDVGQGIREEIDFQVNGVGGANYGWRLREGTQPTPGVGGDPPADNVEPVYDYNRDNDDMGGTVVTGGYLYRGPDPALQGKYLFLDSRNSAGTTDDNYWMFDPANPFGTVDNIDAELAPFIGGVGTGQFPVSFGEDAMGNLYIAYLVSGEVFRIQTVVVPEPTTALILLSAWPLVCGRRRRAA